MFNVHLIFWFWIQCALAHFFGVLDSVCTTDVAIIWTPDFLVVKKNIRFLFPWIDMAYGGFGFHSSLFGGHGEKVCFFNLYIILEIFDWYFEYIDVLLVKAVTTWKLSSWTKIHCINLSDDRRYRVDINYFLGAIKFDVCTIRVGGTRCIILIKVCFYMMYITRIN